MRTDEQKQAFVMECLEIEKAGGDVLGYIEVNWPSYTPRATWYNLQRQFLKRNTAQLTEGKPERPKGEIEEMAKRDRMKTLDCVIEVIGNGGHPFDYLESIGYLNPMQAWADLKNWARKNAPEKFEQLPKNLKLISAKPLRVKTSRPEPKAEPAPDLKAGEPLPVKLPAGGKIEAGKPSPFPDPDYSNEMIIPRNTGDHVSAEDFRKTVEFNGKEYERMNKPSPTCCQPERPSGVTVQDELPDEPKPLEIVAVRCSVKRDATYEKRNVSDQYGKYVSLVWHEPAGGEQCLTLEVKDWLKLAEEIPQMLKQLGLSN